MRYRFVLLLLVLFLFGALSSGHAYADGDIAISYLHLRNQLPTPPGTAVDLETDENSEPQPSRYYELSGSIVGQVSSDGQPILILQCQNGFSAEIAVKQPFIDKNDWMSTGSVIRILVKSADTAVGSVSTPVLDLVAAGPEDSVSFAEKKIADDEAQIAAAVKARVQARLQNRQIAAETSRSASMPARFVLSSVPVNGLSDRAAAIYPAYHNTISRLNPNLSEADVCTITKSILYYSDIYQIDPRLIVAMVVAESGFDPNSVSRTGAMGLGQLMPETAASLGVTDAFDPQQNIAAAVHLLSDHVQRYGGASPCGVIPINTLLLTMAAYNAGPGAVKKYGGIPPYRETQNYVRKVNELYRQLCGS